MSHGCFTDKKRQPGEDEVRAAIGARLPAWDELIRYIRIAYSPQEDFKYLYGQNYGWALRFRLKSQMLVNLFPRQDGFTAQVNLTEAAVQQALGQGVSPGVQQTIAAAHPYPEGRWLFIRVESDADLESIRQLLALRVTMKHR